MPKFRRGRELLRTAEVQRGNSIAQCDLLAKEDEIARQMPMAAEQARKSLAAPAGVAGGRMRGTLRGIERQAGWSEAPGACRRASDMGQGAGAVTLRYPTRKRGKFASFRRKSRFVRSLEPGQVLT